MTRSIDADAAVVLRERLFDAVDPAEWDRFVVESGGSFLGSWKVVAAEALIRTVRIVELFSTAVPRGKIGQCAVAVAPGRLRFVDRLHILPAYVAFWPEGLRHVIQWFGGGGVTYGSPWNHEERCLAAARASLPDGRLVDACFGIDRVDFGAWPDFAAYRRGISENIRRDYRKAAAASPVVTTRRGLSALRDVPGLVGLRREVMRRNAEPFSSLVDAPRHALKLFALGDDAFISSVTAEGSLQASFFGVRFGDAIYHLGGGTRDRSHGFGSYLFLALLETWFVEHPRGALYLGENIPNVDPRTYTRGNLLYRRKLRATVIPGTAFRIDVG